MFDRIDRLFGRLIYGTPWWDEPHVLDELFPEPRDMPGLCPEDIITP